MPELLSSLSNNYTLWLIATIVSGTVFVGTLVAVPILCVRLPEDFFIRPLQRRAPWKVALRTTAAVIVLAMGIAMLVLPGQGVLTILIGISLLDFPAKRAWQRRILQIPAVLRTINRIRGRACKPPLQT